MEGIATFDEAKQMIQEIVDAGCKLTDFEHNFIFGEEGDKRPGAKDRRTLSMRQIEIVQEIYDERIAGQGPKKKEAPAESLDYGIVAAHRGKSAWQITVHGKPVGTEVIRKEADILVPFLSITIDALTKILANGTMKSAAKVASNDPPFGKAEPNEPDPDEDNLPF